MPIHVSDILKSLEHLAPAALAESWDNVGLLVGDPAQVVTRVLVALDATPEALDQAADAGTELLVVHHPLIFAGMKRLTEDGGVASLARRLVREGRSLLALHTNLDAAPEGLNHYVATQLGLADLRSLVPSEQHPLLKLVVFVPDTHADRVREVICGAGAGHIGRYDECTFSAPGTGTFRPEEGATPYIGIPGTLERVHEQRLETVVPRPALPRVLAAMLAAHPYEEVAYDLYPLDNAWPGAGLGRVGRLDAPMTAADFLRRVAAVLETDRLALAGDPARTVQQVALCTGAGSDFIPHAIRAGADLYLTGEVKHHQALLARQHGLLVLDAGHFATEHPAVSLLAGYLHAYFPDLTIHCARETDPLQSGDG